MLLCSSFFLNFLLDSLDDETVFRLEEKILGYKKHKCLKRIVNKLILIYPELKYSKY